MPYLAVLHDLVIAKEETIRTDMDPDINWMEVSDDVYQNVEMNDLYCSNNHHLTPGKFSYDHSEKTWAYFTPEPEAVLEGIRQERQMYLDQSDWRVLPDSPLTPAQKTTWRNYRQQLRDLPTSNTNPLDIVMPEPPSD